jgi:hypothetical protein
MTRAAVVVLLEILGVLLITAGVAAVYWPAALVVAGVALFLIAWRMT